MDTSHLRDDALSGSLDGDLDAAAQDHLAGCSACAGRREQLAAARAALAGAPVEAVDELTKRRMVAAALAAADATGTGTPASTGAPPGTGRRWWYRHPATAGAVAAVLLALLVAVPFLADNGAGGDGDESATAALEEAGGAFVGDLGDVSDPATLRARFGGDQRALALTDRASGGAAPETAADMAEAPGAESAPAAPAPAPAPPAAGTTGNATAAGVPGEAYATNQARDGAGPDDTGIDRTVAEACGRQLAEAGGRGGLVAVGTGTYQGTEVVVAIFDRSGVRTAYLAAGDGCEVLANYRV